MLVALKKATVIYMFICMTENMLPTHFYYWRILNVMATFVVNKIFT